MSRARVGRTDRRRVLLVMPIRPGGDLPATSYIRLLRPLTHPSLADLIEVRPVSAEELGRCAGDVCLVQRTALGDETAARALIETCRERGMRLMYEVDDDLFDQPPPRLLAAAGAARRLAAARSVAAAAEVIMVATTELATVMGGLFSARVCVVPNALDERLWLAGEVRPAADGLAQRALRWLRRPGERLRILFMGTASHGEDLRLLEEPVRRLIADTRGRVEFETVGVVDGKRRSDWYRPVAMPVSAGANHAGFVRWLRARRGYDFAVAPLIDSPFNRCKSSLKYLDYAALRLPAVFSDLPVYRKAVSHDETGILVANAPDAWYGALRRLAGDRDLRCHLGQACHADLVANHTLAAQARQRRQLWMSILGEP